MVRAVFNPTDVLTAFSFSASVTSTAEVDTLDGDVVRTVTSPAHLAAYDANNGAAGVYRYAPREAIRRPLVLYPGQLSISVAYPGGTISLVQAPWAVGPSTMTIGYRVMLGDAVLATSLPYDTASRTPGQRLVILTDVTAGGVTTTVTVGEFTMAENPLGPQLSGFAVNYTTNAVAFVSDISCTARWRRYANGHVFANEPQEIWDGTGAIDGGEFAVASGPQSRNVNLTGGVSGNQLFRLVARVGGGPLSNPIGGPVRITPSGATLTAPQFRSTGFGGSGTSAVTTYDCPLPVYSAGDIVQLPIGIDCAASRIAGITVTVTGETVTAKQVLVDNGVSGDDGQSAALYYFRAATGNPDGVKVATIAITAGGAKSTENIICTPSVRFTAKASGDPFAQVVKRDFATAALEISSAALTAVNAQSRIETFMVSEIEAPVGSAPAGWTLRQQGRSGPQSAQLLSRNTATEASESIAAINMPLPVARRGISLTWELLPEGA